jgi:hypothetical protein
MRAARGGRGCNVDVLTVADNGDAKKRRARKPKEVVDEQPRPEPLAVPEWTTMRIYGEDGEELSELAKAERKTIAEIFRLYLKPVIRERLIPLADARLRRLKGEE